MLFDLQNMFTTGTQVGPLNGNLANLTPSGDAITATANSSNVIDMWGQATLPTTVGLAGISGVASPNANIIRDWGRTILPEILVEVVQTFTAAGAATMQVQLINADDTALSTNATVVQETPVLGKAVFVAGYQVRFALPSGLGQRYLGLKFTVATGPMTAGIIVAGLLADTQSTFVG